MRGLCVFKERAQVVAAARLSPSSGVQFIVPLLLSSGEVGVLFCTHSEDNGLESDQPRY